MRFFSTSLIFLFLFNLSAFAKKDEALNCFEKYSKRAKALHKVKTIAIGTGVALGVGVGAAVVTAFTGSPIPLIAVAIGGAGTPVF
ncbi:MAG: hypothetical protein HOE90_09485 [Bacteriovoracaceae bacterium]|jgi:hypothetical protein|nr:hypothetical protein [Bacteriovoracaceae bacterium]